MLQALTMDDRLIIIIIDGGWDGALFLSSILFSNLFSHNILSILFISSLVWVFLSKLMDFCLFHHQTFRFAASQLGFQTYLFLAHDKNDIIKTPHVTQADVHRCYE